MSTITQTTIENGNIVNRTFSQNTVSLHNYFSVTNTIVTIDLSAWDVSNISDFSNMFEGCIALVSINISNWNTSKATNMSCMFRNCEHLTTIIGLEDLDVSNVTTFHRMFYGCYFMQSINISNWNTEHVNITSGMFEKCWRLTNIQGIEHLNMRHVVDTTEMFKECWEIKSLQLTWQTDSFHKIGHMFWQCFELSRIDGINQWNVENVEFMNDMFYECESLVYLNLDNWNVSNVKITTRMFSGCLKLISLNISRWTPKTILITEDMFEGCWSLRTIDLSNWDTSKLVRIRGMFANCINLVSVNLSNWNIGNICVYNHVFHNCPKLIEVDLRNWKANSDIRPISHEDAIKRKHDILICCQNDCVIISESKFIDDDVM